MSSMAMNDGMFHSYRLMDNPNNILTVQNYCVYLFYNFGYVVLVLSYLVTSHGCNINSLLFLDPV